MVQDAVGAMESEQIFFYLDGDNVGSPLELFLLDNLVDDAREYSIKISTAVAEVSGMLQGRRDVAVILSGGDDVLACWPRGALKRADIAEICEIFYRSCGRTASVGIGKSLRNSALNLRRAKLSGKAAICDGGEAWE